MTRSNFKRPGYLLHKASGQARVRINGHDIYLGAYDSRESWEKYHRLIADLHLPVPTLPTPASASDAISVAELTAHYVQFANEYYGRTNPDEKYRIKAAIAPLIELFASLPVNEFSPRKLKQVRQHLIDRGHHRTKQPLSRKYVNQVTAVIKQIFKWGVSEELVPVTVYQALATVASLRKGRAPGVAEPNPIKPVPDEHIPPVVAVVSDEVGTMIGLQRLTGMRPDEVTIMRACDIEKLDNVWRYTIASRFQGADVAARGSKTDWRENVQAKQVFLGPQAQKLLKPWLARRSADSYLFSPRRVARRSGRKLPTKPREHYDDDSYRQAVTRGCERAGVPAWTPGQLRHNAATDIKRRFGIEAARLVLGHTELSTTEIYAERDHATYRTIMAEIG